MVKRMTQGAYADLHHGSSSHPVLILLVLGGKLFWLCVAVLGFFLGMEFAGALLVDQPKWVMLVIGLGAGLLGALLAMLAERVAFALAGFYAGGYLALIAAPSFGSEGHSTLWFAAGGVIGPCLHHWVTEFRMNGKLYIMDYRAGGPWLPMNGVHEPYDSLKEYETFLSSLHVPRFVLEYARETI